MMGAGVPPEHVFLRERTTKPFRLVSPFQPTGDQPHAIAALCAGVEHGEQDQVLLGVTGSGKTFTVANVIQHLQRPTLILAPNKTLAAQLYGELKTFFPDNAVEYFVSYYDYYRPEAYIPHADVFIEKEASINAQIERMRHSATRALLERNDVIVVASVSCIYGLGSVDFYYGLTFTVEVGQKISMKKLFSQLTHLQYKRQDIDFQRGDFRVRGDRIDIFPSHYENRAWSISFWGDEVESIKEIDVLTGNSFFSLEKIIIFPNSHYVTPGPTIQQAITGIKKELKQRLDELTHEDRLVEAQRLRERISYDIETMSATGSCPGIENYSRYLTGRAPGEAPPTLFEYFPKNSLLVVDESHVSIPQLRGMYLGDKSRKTTLSEYGFRLPSCRDNRPLMFEEWEEKRPQTLFVSATPGPWELEKTSGTVIEQVLRPTGLLDPICEVRPSHNQMENLVGEMHKVIQEKGRVLVVTLTKRMAEDLSEYLGDIGMRSRYMHSDINVLERIEILQDLRKGIFDVLIGINLLREGLDIPECQMVAIFDADKEGYLRSRTSLIQIMGRAARHPKGKVLLYADKMTDALQQALGETFRRRQKQEEYNTAHGITPRAVSSSGALEISLEDNAVSSLLPSQTPKTSKPSKMSKASKTSQGPLKKSLETLRLEMLAAAEQLDFEKAAALRDEIAARGKKSF